MDQMDKMDPPSEETSTPDSIPGYEKMQTVGEDGLLHPPAASNQHPQPETQPPCPKWDVPPLSKEDAQKALISYASNKLYYSTKPAEYGVITNMEAFDTYRYCLETYTETRTTKWSRTPYYGEKIDTGGQTPPGPWDIPVCPPPFFQNGSEISEIPHTSSVKDCSHCRASGRIKCSFCFGRGKDMCYQCCGSGSIYVYPNMRTCYSCSGRREKTCMPCNGSGLVQCDVSFGRRRVVTSLSLTVNWVNHEEKDTVEQSSGLKMSQLSNVPGKILFTHSDQMVSPIADFPDPALVQISKTLLQEHRAKYLPTSQILQQRHTIELIPVTKVTYEWKQKPYVFYVYGSDFQVTAEDYPAACCGCCTVM